MFLSIFSDCLTDGLSRLHSVAPFDDATSVPRTMCLSKYVAWNQELTHATVAKAMYATGLPLVASEAIGDHGHKLLRAQAGRRLGLEAVATGALGTQRGAEAASGSPFRSRRGRRCGRRLYFSRGLAISCGRRCWTRPPQTQCRSSVTRVLQCSLVQELEINSYITCGNKLERNLVT